MTSLQTIKCARRNTLIKPLGTYHQVWRENGRWIFYVGWPLLGKALLGGVGGGSLRVA